MDPIRMKQVLKNQWKELNTIQIPDWMLESESKSFNNNKKKYSY